MSLTTRRYTLQPPTDNYQQQIKQPKYFQTNLNKSLIHENIDDPWVKELLKRDIDFSQLDQQEEEVQLLNIPNIKYSRANPQHLYHHDHFQTRIKSPLIIKDNYDQYSSTSYSQSKF
jgi:hypothetical protein